MANKEDMPVDFLAVDNSPQGIFVFGNDGTLLRNNGKANVLVDSFSPGSIILCEDDILRVFGFEPLLLNNTSENKYSTSPRRDLYVQRKKTGSGCTLYYLIDTSGERLRMAAHHHQTSEILGKIRSKVTSIQNVISYLQDYETERFDSPLYDLLSASRFEIWQLSRYADNLRDLALLNANTLGKQIDMENVSLKECVAEAVINLESFKKNWGKKVFFLDSTQECTVTCDRNRFIRIIESLLINAILHGTDDVSVTIHSDPVTDAIVNISFSDNGANLPDEKLSRVFEYGFRGHAPGKSGTSGLGIELFLARQIMTRMNGGIIMENSPGNGVTVTLTVMKGTAANDS